MTLNGRPIDSEAAVIESTINNFLASGGDGYSVLTEGTDTIDAGLDLDALEAWLATNPAVAASRQDPRPDAALACVARSTRAMFVPLG